MTRFALIIIVTFSGVCTAPSLKEDTYPIKVCFGSGPEKILSIPCENIRQAPMWKPESQSEPPISIGKVATIASEWLSRALKDGTIESIQLVDKSRYEIIKMTLVPLERNAWAYEIQFEETNKNDLGWAGGERSRVDVWVDMSGAVWVPK